MIKRFIIVLFLALSCKNLFSQEKAQKVVLNGYLSTMMSSMFDTLSGPFINDNLIHNRLNFKGYVSEKVTMALELRNRLFIGDMARAGNAYSTLIGMDQGLADMSWNILNERSFFFNTTVDRLWFDFSLNKIQATIGRQRINWGQALIWNPNDIFNAYSYFDFDYAERPGSDAVRIQFYPKPSSVLEVAVKGDHNNNVTAAALYRFNKWAYDIQFLGGIFNSDELVAGTGWSGAFGSTSFRGEASWFKPLKGSAGNGGTGMFTMGLDRSFKNNSLAQVQVLLCNKPAEFEKFGTLYSGNITVRELAFSKFSAFGSYSYPITPLFTVTASSMWFPDLKGYFSGVSADYSVAQNVDFTLLWQHFKGKISSEPTRINILFLRFKMSF
jgi:hypothetical protein